MLQKLKQPRRRVASGEHFAIVASNYNACYVDAMLAAATQRLRAAQAKSIEVLRVPGAYEIPVATSVWLKNRPGHWSAVICLGVIIRGQTSHAQLIGEAVTGALMDIQLEYRVPVIHEVLLVENEAQALQRCLDPEHNRGTEAAESALEMAAAIRSLQRPRINHSGP